jgi:hypothetical protein
MSAQPSPFRAAHGTFALIGTNHGTRKADM